MLKFIFVFIVIGGCLLSSCTHFKGPNSFQQQSVADITKLPTFTVATSSSTNMPNSQTNIPVQSIRTATLVDDISTTSHPTATVTSTYTPQPTASIPTNVPMTATLVISPVTTNPPTMTSEVPTKFVTVNDGKFMLGGRPHYFVGTNFWQGMNLGVDGPSGNRARLVEELDRLQQIGVTNLRVMASSEGPDTEPYRITPALMISPGVYNENVFDGLDYFLMEIGKHDMRAVMVLNNYWQWSGGMAQYVSWHEGSLIPYPTPEDWFTFLDYSAKFYKCMDCQVWYRQHIATVINHHNPYTGLKYRDDPTIFSWELANEPRRYTDEWIDETSAYIKSLDPNHLVTTGSEGTPPGESQNFIETHNSPDVDYATIHIWSQNWGWYDPTNPSSYAEAEAKARSYIQNHNTDAMVLGKPFVLEEFGLARDWDAYHDIYNSDSPTTYRDVFFAAMFEEIYTSISKGGLAAGDNFWAWSGQVQPSDNWHSDPPHEISGWYSVYDTDESTIAVISAHAKEMADIQK